MPAKFSIGDVVDVTWNEFVDEGMLEPEDMKGATVISVDEEFEDEYGDIWYVVRLKNGDTLDAEELELTEE